MPFSGEGKAELLAAFVEAQNEFTVPKKNKTAKAGSYSYNYSTLDELIAATRPALSKYKLACFNNVTMPGDNVVMVTSVLVHGPSGQSMESDPIIFHVDGSPQTVGSAITYGKRYAMGAQLGVAAEEDTDGGNGGQQHQQGQQQQQRGPQQRQQGKPQAQSKPQAPPAEEPADEPLTAENAEQPITPAQVARLQRIVKDAGIKGGRMKAWLASMDIASSDAIKRNQYQTIVTVVQSGKVPEAAAK